MKSYKALPDSAFADPIARRYPIIDASHVRNALLMVMWRFNHSGSNSDIRYLEGVHDRILERAEELGMDLNHKCNHCNRRKEKVAFD